MHITIKNKKLYFNKYKTRCVIGKRGISSKKVEGDYKTPRGVFKIEFIMYRKDRLKRFSTRIKKKVIQKNMGWCDDPNVNNYNKLVKLPVNYSNEKLYLKRTIYDLIVVLNYNRKKIIRNKGSAIFLHVKDAKMKYTKGCIAIKKKELIFLLSKINKTTQIKII